MAFTLSIYPWIHRAKFDGKSWASEYIKQSHHTPEEEGAMDEKAHTDLVNHRNNFPDLPLVNYTTQYGLGCFEGLKAFPQPDGKIKLFRPEKNCARMASSMKGLMMPSIDESLLLEALLEIVRRNFELGFTPKYDSAWEQDDWQSGDAAYIRPFSYAESGIGVNLSQRPWVISICTTVSSYFIPGTNAAVTTQRIRATPNGTGWIKTAANYVTSVLAKTEAAQNGYMEAIFLDATKRESIEEGSSCNFFALFPGNRIITPSLGDTILPGITRDSIITLAKEQGFHVTESDLPVTKVLNEAIECFVTGTAAGITPLSSLTHKDRKKEFSSLEDDSVSMRLLRKLKGIQYGAVEDQHAWMVEA